MKGESKTSKSFAGSIVIIVLLAIGLCVTTFALFWTSISVENNIFRTGLVKINLNDGNPVIKEHEFLFEPGMTVEKTFFIENQSTDDVYYKLYFENVEGGLAKVLLISIFDGDNELYSGTAEDLDKDSVGAADDILRLNEKKELKIGSFALFYFCHCERTQESAAICAESAALKVSIRSPRHLRCLAMTIL